MVHGTVGKYLKISVRLQEIFHDCPPTNKNNNTTKIHKTAERLPFVTSMKQCIESDIIQFYLVQSSEINGLYIFTHDINLFDRRLSLTLGMKINELWEINNNKISFPLADKLITKL